MNETQELKLYGAIVVAAVMIWVGWTCQQECIKIQKETKQMREAIQTIRTTLR